VNNLNISEKPKAVNWPETHYVFVEKIGPFMETAAAAWQELRAFVPELSKISQSTKYFSQYKIESNKMTYRAGVAVNKRIEVLPAGLQYEFFSGGNYSCFTYVGPYTKLPEACGFAFNYVEEHKVPVRKDWNIEHYVNDPQSTPQDECVTEIMFPTA
jgi:DNA gyrase inhibitor GyrI